MILSIELMSGFSSTTSISSTSVTTSSQTETLSGIEGKAFLEVNHDGSFVAGQAGFQDIDGDGKTDLIFQNNTLDFYVSSGSSTGLVSTSLSFSSLLLLLLLLLLLFQLL